jgi:hypothetical protein
MVHTMLNNAIIGIYYLYFNLQYFKILTNDFLFPKYEIKQ